MTEDSRRHFFERIGLLGFATVYLVVFRTRIFSGDGFAYVRQIESGVVEWNPNHLLMGPLAAFWHHLLHGIGLDVTPIASLKILAGVATLVSLIAFHVVLVHHGTDSSARRILACVGLLFSAAFLSLAVSEEFFMVQVPLLVTALGLGLTADRSFRQGREANLQLALGAVCLALAVLILASNIALVGLFGIFVASGLAATPQKLRRVVLFGGLAGVLVFGGLAIAWAATGPSGVGFIEWLTAYQGDEGSKVGGLYGLELSPVGFAESAARLTYNVFSSVGDPGGLGTVLKVVVFSQPLEFQPSYIRVSLGVLLIAALITLAILTFPWLIRERRSGPVRLGLLWAAAYAIFNFWWNDSSDQFYVQILPVLWFWLSLAAWPSDRPSRETARAPTDRASLRRCMVFAVVPLLVIVNTANVVAPYALVDMEELQGRHQSLLRAGDLEIIPGWDRIQWLINDEADFGFDQLRLMGMALGEDRNGTRIEDLPAIVETYLSEGRRVFVARLYDLDRSPRPWDQLRKLGWPRERLQKLFERFKIGEPIEVGDVTIRELRTQGGHQPVLIE